jgi:hypothetical protein
MAQRQKQVLCAGPEGLDISFPLFELFFIHAGRDDEVALALTQEFCVLEFRVVHLDSGFALN